MLQDVLWHIALPAITLSFGTIAILTRIMRASMLDVLNQDYIKTARSKGLSEDVVIKKHARQECPDPHYHRYRAGLRRASWRGHLNRNDIPLARHRTLVDPGHYESRSGRDHGILIAGRNYLCADEPDS